MAGIQCVRRTRHSMRRRLSTARSSAVITTILVVSSLVLGQAAPPAAKDDELAVKVKALIRTLDSEELAKREAAEKEIVALGPAVVPLLPTTTARTPAEVRNRLMRIRNALVKAEVEAATRPSLVTLAGEMSV